MEEIPVSESHEPKINSTIERALLFVGERLAFFLFAIFACVLIVSGTIIPQAFSEQEEPQFSKEDSNWYQQEIAFPQKQAADGTSFSLTAVEVTPTPTPTAAPTPIVATVSDDVWDKLADCESHKNWSINSGNGYYGGLQFSEGAWRSVGGSGLPHEASRDEQIMRGKMLQEKRGWGPWGACSKKLGLL